MIKEINKICSEVHKTFGTKAELNTDDVEIITINFNRSYIKKAIVNFYQYRIVIKVYENGDLVHESPYQFNEGTWYNAAVYLLNVLTSSGWGTIL